MTSPPHSPPLSSAFSQRWDNYTNHPYHPGKRQRLDCFDSDDEADVKDSAPVRPPPSSRPPFSSYPALRNAAVLSAMLAATSGSASAVEGYRVDGLIARLISDYLEPVPLHLVLRHPQQQGPFEPPERVKVDEKPHPTSMCHHLEWIASHVRHDTILAPNAPDRASTPDDFPPCDGHRAHSLDCCRRLSQGLRLKMATHGPLTLYASRQLWHMLACIEGYRLTADTAADASTDSDAAPSFSPPFFAFTLRDESRRWEGPVQTQRLNCFAALRLYLVQCWHLAHPLLRERQRREWNGALALPLAADASPQQLRAFALELSEELTLELLFSARRLDVNQAAAEREEAEAELWRERTAEEERSGFKAVDAPYVAFRPLDEDMDSDGEWEDGEEGFDDQHWMEAEGAREDNSDDDEESYPADSEREASGYGAEAEEGEDEEEDERN